MGPAGGGIGSLQGVEGTGLFAQPVRSLAVMFFEIIHHHVKA